PPVRRNRFHHSKDETGAASVTTGAAAVSRNPLRQLGNRGSQSSSRRALALLEPRTCVISEIPTSPTANLASHAGTRRGGFAPSHAAREGSHSRTRAGSPSTML